MSKKVHSAVAKVGRWTSFFFKQVRIFRHCFRMLSVNRGLTQGAALAYHTVFGIVPLTIVMVMVFQMIPGYGDIGARVRHVVYEQFGLYQLEYPSEGAEVASVPDKIEELTQGYMKNLSTGGLLFTSGLLVIWAAIGLFGTIEKAFNLIWHVPRGRGFLHRLISYWALITWGPLLLGVGIYVSTYPKLANFIGEDVMRTLTPVLNYLLSLLALLFLYLFIPNTKVRLRPALWGAVAASVMWLLAKWGFGLYVVKVVPFNAVYGILGIIPLSVFWIYLTWLIVLFGLQLAYATQNLQTLEAEELERLRRSGGEMFFLANDQTVTRIMEFVLRVFEQKDEQPVSIEMVASNLGIPAEMSQKVLDHMVKAGLLCHTNEPVVGYVPSTDGSHISLADISRAVEEVSFAPASAAETPRMVAVFHEIRQMLANYTLRDVLEPFQRERLRRTEKEKSETESKGD